MVEEQEVSMMIEDKKSREITIRNTVNKEAIEILQKEEQLKENIETNPETVSKSSLNKPNYNMKNLIPFNSYIYFSLY